MERKKLTKEDIDKVRNIEGFPIGTDEDIIALSDAPYYTACPNPFIEEFIEEYGTPYNEETDEYHREPLATDVSEGKYHPVYRFHPYHTKVPHRAIVRYIMHYTNPGDLVLDGFCGTGMTGVAANECDNPEEDLKYEIEREEKDVQWGLRHAILADLSPIASFIAYGTNTKVNSRELQEEIEDILQKCDKECGWMFETNHQDGLSGVKGVINYMVWSDVYICPHCGNEFIFWNDGVDIENGKVLNDFHCSNCKALIKKKECQHAMRTIYDDGLDSFISVSKQVPVYINYTFGGRKYEKKPDSFDLALLEKVEKYHIPYWYPTDRMCVGDEARRNDEAGITHVHHFYTKRNLAFLACFNHYCTKPIHKLFLTRVAFRMTKRYALTYMKGCWGAGGGPTSGTLYIPALMKELPIGRQIHAAIKPMIQALTTIQSKGENIISTQSSTRIDAVRSNSIDYIFIDPPFGSNLMYSELNFIWEAWIKSITNQSTEAIVNTSQKKEVYEYQQLLVGCLREFYRVLKPNRWITIEFHNSQNAIWNAIQEAIQVAGFIIADVRVLDKKKGSFVQITSTSSVKQDLVISAYKPKESFCRDFMKTVGQEDTAWSFVNQHLSQLPIVVDADKNGKIDIIAERQAYLLFDRMISYHIMQGVAVPIDATDFYKGLDERFLKRDDMYFLPNQVNEYDYARSTADVEEIQLAYLVTDEKSAIQWLYNELKKPQTYQDIMPKFMKAMQVLDKHEKMPELAEILEENFLKDDDGKWYIPDLTKSGDIAKLREKNLLKEFQEYLESKGKLKVFRSEAVRAGFAKLWKDKDYKSIVNVAERLPEKIIQEDSNLLMYYDISLSRV